MEVVRDFTRRYLQRIHCDGLYEVSVQNLFQLHQKHLEYTVFENVNCYFKKKLNIDKDFLFNKIVVEQKGGFCFELNAVFYFLLEELGYNVKILQAFVYNARTNKLEHGDKASHILCMVDLNGKRFLADVGVSSRGFLFPLEFKEGETDQGLHGVFKLTKNESDQTWLLQSRNRVRRPANMEIPDDFVDGLYNEYVFDEMSVSVSHAQELLAYQVQNPYFIFNRVLVFERLLPNGYKMLFGNDFADIQMNQEDGNVVINAEKIQNDVEKLHILKTHFNCYYINNLERT